MRAIACASRSPPDASGAVRIEPPHERSLPVQRILQMQKLLLRSRPWPWLVAGVTLAILGGAIFLTTHLVRARIREQIISRDGDILHAVALLHLSKDAADGRLIGAPEDPGNQLDVALEISRLKGVLGVRLFDVRGKFVGSFPGYVLDSDLDPSALSTLQKLHPVSVFQPALSLANLFLTESGQSPPEAVLEVNVPLHTRADGPLIGIVQFITKGDSIAQEFSRLDRHLVWQGSLTFAATGTILGLFMAWAFRRLEQGAPDRGQSDGGFASRQPGVGARCPDLGRRRGDVASHPWFAQSVGRLAKFRRRPGRHSHRPPGSGSATGGQHRSPDANHDYPDRLHPARRRRGWTL